MNICKQLREALGLTVSRLSKESKMATATLKFYETGGNVTERSIAKLAEFFGVTTDELEGRQTLDVGAWLAKRNGNKQEKAENTSAPTIHRQEPELHQRGIVQVIKVSDGAANYYLEEGWILLDSAPMKDDNGFYCLLGSTKPFSFDDFQRVKTKKAPKAKSYWMQKS